MECVRGAPLAAYGTGCRSPAYKLPGKNADLLLRSPHTRSAAKDRSHRSAVHARYPFGWHSCTSRGKSGCSALLWRQTGQIPASAAAYSDARSADAVWAGLHSVPLPAHSLLHHRIIPAVALPLDKIPILPESAPPGAARAETAGLSAVSPTRGSAETAQIVTKTAPLPPPKNYPVPRFSQIPAMPSSSWCCSFCNK